jgi:hypothetical protein
MKEFLSVLAVGVTAGLLFIIAHSVFTKLIWHLVVKKSPLAAWLNGLFTPILTLSVVIFMSLCRDYNFIPRDLFYISSLFCSAIMVPYAIKFILKVDKNNRN